MNELQIGHEIFGLHSQIFIKKKKIIEIPNTKAIIRHVEVMATNYKVTSLKFINKSGVIHDNDYISGVEHEN